jgi:glycerophosphoryl diester phosphodiesterase
MVTPAGLAGIARYADAIGPAKVLIVPRGPDGRSLPPTSLVADAHRAGLQVHPWTFRSENFFLPAELRRGDDPRGHGDAAAEYRQFYALGVDGLFSDFAADAVAARGPAVRR